MILILNVFVVVVVLLSCVCSVGFLLMLFMCWGSWNGKLC